MTDTELDGMLRDCNVIRPHEVRRLVAEVRLLRSLLLAPGTGNSNGSAAMTEELSRMTGERFATSARAALPGTTTA